MKGKMQKLPTEQKQEQKREPERNPEQESNQQPESNPEKNNILELESLKKLLKKRRPINPKKLWILRILGVVFLIGALVAHVLFGRPKDIPQERVLLTYNYREDASYKVHLHPNELFETDTLDEGMIYSSKLTEAITADFTADLEASAPAMLGADYTLKIFLVGKQGIENPAEVYRKEYVLTEKSIPYEEQESIHILESVRVDPAEYAEVINQIEEIIGATTDELFYLEFSGTYYLGVDGGEKEETFSYSLPLPLTSEVPLYKIDKVPALPAEGSISIPGFTTVTPSNAVKYPIRVGAVFGLFLLLVSFLLFRRPNEHENTTLQMEEILRKYASRMARIKESPSVSDKECMEVFSMEALLLLADELQTPVLYCGDEKEVENNTFYVLDKNRVYLYILL